MAGVCAISKFRTGKRSSHHVLDEFSEQVEQVEVSGLVVDGRTFVASSRFSGHCACFSVCLEDAARLSRIV